MIIGLIQDLFSLFIMVVAISGAYAGEIMIGTVMAYLNAITMIETLQIQLQQAYIPFIIQIYI